MARKTRFSNIQLGLAKMQRALQSGVLDTFALDGAERMLQIVKQQCPVDTGKLRDSLHITATDRSRRGSRSTSTLSVENTYCFITTYVYYAWFVEFGAPGRNLPARPFMRPAFDTAARPIADGITAGVEGLLVQLFVSAL